MSKKNNNDGRYTKSEVRRIFYNERNREKNKMSIETRERYVEKEFKTISSIQYDTLRVDGGDLAKNGIEEQAIKKNEELTRLRKKKEYLQNPSKEFAKIIEWLDEARASTILSFYYEKMTDEEIARETTRKTGEYITGPGIKTRRYKIIEHVAEHYKK